MWYAHRGDAYRIGYAESDDGLSWRRRDAEVRLEGVAGEWDGEMQAYPFVTRIGGRRVLFYNGDGYGRTGIGYAVGDGRSEDGRAARRADPPRA